MTKTTIFRVMPNGHGYCIDESSESHRDWRELKQEAIERAIELAQAHAGSVVEVEEDGSREQVWPSVGGAE